jgi:hypothetical protein
LLFDISDRLQTARKAAPFPGISRHFPVLPVSAVTEKEGHPQTPCVAARRQRNARARRRAQIPLIL